MVVKLEDFTEADLWKVRKAASKVKPLVHCKLCRCKFKPKNKKQEFHSTSCRVRYWQLKQEMTEQELQARLSYLHEKGEIG